MRSIHVTRPMTAPRTAVWSVLADFPNISAWNGGVTNSYATSEATRGVGATRHCDLAPMGELEETIAAWDEGSRMVVDIDSAKRLPIRRGTATFALTDGATSIDYEYEPSPVLGRVLGPLLDRQLTKGFEGFLADLDAAAAKEPATG